MASSQRSKMSGFKSVLCAVDFSQQSYAALQTAVQITRRSGGHLTVLCVEDPLTSAGAAASGYDVELVKKATLGQLERLMAQMVTPAGLAADQWSVEALIGKAARSITNFARKMPADLIVMGTNGRTGPIKLLFGSVADAVLRRAPAPVLIVSRKKLKPAEQSDAVRSVIGAIELGDDDQADARRIARAAEKMGGPLTLLHVVYQATGVPALSPSLDVYYSQQLSAAETRLARIAKSVGAQSRIVLGRPEDEIAAVAEDTRAGLIILALRRGRGMFGPRQGATTYRVLCSSTIPVLALPPA